MASSYFSKVRAEKRRGENFCSIAVSGQGSAISGQQSANAEMTADR
jgi:hypothetical protein